MLTDNHRFRVLTAELSHETNTFSIFPTTLEGFERHAQSLCLTTEEVYLKHNGCKSPIGATLEAANKYNWSLTNTISAMANPAGKVTKDTFELLCNKILTPCQQISGANSFDGVLLHLHGAMVAEEFDDAEGELLRRLRILLGPKVPIVATLDLHGNISELMTTNSTALIAVRTYPHIDFYETAWRGAELLQKVMLGEVKPLTVIAKRPQLKGLDFGKTHPASPMTELIRQSEILEASGEVLVVSICAGFTAADIYDIGPSVTVTVDAGKEVDEKAALARAKDVAERMMDYCWETRHYQSETPMTIEQGIDHAKNYIRCEWPVAQKPLIIADVSDNPGSGHYGDCTALLEALINSESIENILFYAIYDPSAVLQGQSIGVGKTGTISLGGKFDPSAGGGPLTLEGKVVSLTDGCFPTFGPMGMGGLWQNFGLSMMFRCGKVEIIVISNNGQLLDTAQITSLGGDIVHAKVICVKSKQHFRAALGPYAGEIIAVDGGGLGSKILAGAVGSYKNVRRPIWPIDDVAHP